MRFSDWDATAETEGWFSPGSNLCEIAATIQETVQEEAGRITRNTPGVADDLTQEFYLKILRGAFKGWSPQKGPLSRFLSRALKNLRIDHYRATTTTITSSAIELAVMPEESGEENRLTEIVTLALDRLREFQEARPDCLYWTILSARLSSPEISGEEIAAAHGYTVSREAARKILQRARRKLHQFMVVEANIQGVSLEDLVGDRKMLALLVAA